VVVAALIFATRLGHFREIASPRHVIT